MSEPTAEDIRWLDSVARFAAAQTGARGYPAAALVVDEAEGLVLGRSTTGSPAGGFEGAALAEAGGAARGRTLYATVDPDPASVIEAGIARVVIGALDPASTRHAATIEAFGGAGVEVVVAAHAPSERLLEASALRAARRRPFVTMRLAVSRDGMLARRDGTHVAIMGPAATRWALFQRSLHEAIVVGARTANLDDDRLDEVLNGLDAGRFARIVAIGATTLPPRHYLERSAAVRPTFAVVVEGRGPALPAGIDVVAVAGRNGRPDLRRMLTHAGWSFSSVLVEPGARLAEAMLSTEMVDRLHLVECATEVGRGGLPATAFGGLAGRLRAAGLVEVATEELGADRLRTFEPAR